VTADDIRSTIADGPCIGNTTEGQLQWLQTILLWKILNGDVVMTGGDIQDLLNDSACIANLTAGQLQWIQTQLLWDIFITGGGGGGGGGVAIEGANFCFSGVVPNQVFKLKNLDTGAANRLDTRKADPDQIVEVQDQSSC